MKLYLIICDPSPKILNIVEFILTKPLKLSIHCSVQERGIMSCTFK